MEKNNFLKTSSDKKSLNVNDKTKRKRPIFITVLSLLHIIGGAFFFFLAVISVFLPEYSATLTSFFGGNVLNPGETSWVLSFFYLLASSLGLSSGIGMIIGAKWGWYLGTFYYAYNLFRNFNGLFLISNIISLLPHEILTTIPQPEYEFYKHLMRILIYAVIYVVFFTKFVGRYFRINPERKYIVVIIQFFICIILASGVTSLVQ